MDDTSRKDLSKRSISQFSIPALETESINTNWKSNNF